MYESATSFEVGVGIRKDFVMPLRLFDILYLYGGESNGDESRILTSFRR